MSKYKVVFRFIRGRAIPIRKAIKTGVPDEVQKLEHIQRARKFLKENAKPGKFGFKFHQIAKKQSKELGKLIGKRLKKRG